MPKRPENPETSPNAHATLRFLFLIANDIRQVSDFYGKTLGLPVTGDDDGHWAQIDAGVKLIFFKGDYPLTVPGEWAFQPGYKSGNGHLTSWSLAYPDETGFRAAVRRIAAGGCEVYSAAPEWRRDSYWGHTVRDPMGNTIEIYWSPADKPDVLTWT